MTKTVNFHDDLMLDVCRKRALGQAGSLGNLHAPKLRVGGVGLVFLMIGGDVQVFAGDHPMDATSEALRALDDFFSEVDAASGEVHLVTSGEDVSRDEESDSLGCVLHLEGGKPVRQDLGLLRTFWRLGVRSIGLTWNHGNQISDGCLDSRGSGLTEFGKDLVREMNHLGMLVDVAHLSDAGIADVLRVADSPVIASHANARALCEHPRNLTDTQLRGISSTGGVVGVCFYPPLVAKAARQTLNDVLSHVKYIVELVGIEHIGIGPDFTDSFPPEWINSALLADARSELTRAFPAGIEDARKLPALRERMISDGFGQDETDLIMGGNVRRVLQDVLEG